ncbi:adenylosuccinate synthase [Faecousia sp. CLA-AA-H192]|uniref:Adenylosuccinate synthetase n=1 Tax=Faecousia intestinalis TaxID=3133167 RepID=A0ABV1G5I0_9FIRM
MSNCAVVGINWGDEGKGRMVDLIAKDYDIVIRYQGGNNAGHTIVNEYGKFALHLIPSGIFSEGVVNVLGNGVVIDLEDLCREIDNLRAHGIRITPENLKISERATIVFPFHRALDGLEEARLKDQKYGSTLRGIAPVYSDKYQKKTVMLGELLYPEHLKAHLATILEWKNLIIHNVYGAEPYKLEDMLAWCEEFGGKLRPFLCDVPKYLYEAEKAGKNIMFEAQLGALRDIDFGIYPYTSSSSSIAGYACVGAGMPGSHVDRTVGIVKAYSTCVGEGPFTAEWFGEKAENLREKGGEYGASTGRPRRVGPIDLVATRYGCRIQGATEVALTKLDVLSGMKEVPLCVQYELNGALTDDFPFPAILPEAKPVFRTMPGWNCDISGVRRYEDLPKEARDYVETVEKAIGCHISYVSVGAEREAIITR